MAAVPYPALHWRDYVGVEIGLSVWPDFGRSPLARLRRRRAVRPFPTRHSAPSVPTISSCVLHALCASMSSTIHARDHRVRVNLPLYPLARAWYLVLCVIPGMLVSVREECGHGLR